MSKTEGEYELVLGNRQLLSAFFIIVILFGVFFTMGYVVGRNSAPASAASSTASGVAANVKPDSASPAPAVTPPVTPPAETPKETPPARIETKPVAPADKPAEKTEAPAPAKRTPMKSAEPSPSRAAASSTGVPAITPGPGRMYLQVAAVAQPQAGVVVDTLKQKGFPAMLAQGPNATLFRVVVGPYPDAASAGKAKAGLESAGFRPILRK
ncbi:MAG TPA: SPOR domain-containing protein [Bryobacteraceae bacterium]|nr:SPOR domain-containing protein [Bryobacteraceae bacterium]